MGKLVYGFNVSVDRESARCGCSKMSDLPTSISAAQPMLAEGIAREVGHGFGPFLPCLDEKDES